jgi:hypothetical protein
MSPCGFCDCGPVETRPIHKIAREIGWASFIPDAMSEVDMEIDRSMLNSRVADTMMK